MRTHRLVPLSLALGAVLGANPALAATAATAWSLDLASGTGNVEFHAIGNPGFLRIKGRAAKPPKGVLEIRGAEVTGEISIDLDSIDTGMSLRNRHMKEKYLETAKYPVARLRLVKLSLPPAFQETSAEFDAPFQATLDVHGTPSPVTGTIKVARRAERVTVAADFETKVADHRIEKPGYLGVTMADVVKIHCEFDAPLKAGR